MAYATNNGTIQQMIDAMATFALANGWAARTPVDHRYWSVVGYSRDTINPIDVAVDFIRMSETPGGANVLTGGTASATSGTASNALVNDGTTWVGTGGVLMRWVYDFGGGNEKDIREVELEFANTTHAWEAFELQFSDDGTEWTTMKAFVPEVTVSGLSFIGTWTATDWPLTPDSSNYVDVTYNTVLSDTEWVIGGGSQPLDIIEIYVQVGRDQLAPLGRVASISTVITDTIEEWHFFNEAAVSNHLHVVFRCLKDGESYWHHMSMGEIDKKGMTHNGVAYCTTSRMIPYAEEDDGNTSLSTGRHNVLARAGYFLTGIDSDLGVTSVYYRFTEGASYPLPDDGFWPSRADRHTGSTLAPTLLARAGFGINASQMTPASDDTILLGGIGWLAEPHPTTGFLTLGVIPFIVINDDDSDADWCVLGEYPNVRSIRVDNLADGGEITVGADTWKCFPMLRKVAEASSFGTPAVRNPQSGPAGIAYKKVV